MKFPGSDALFDPTDEHRLLRQTIADFARREVDPQAAEHDAKGTLNVGLFRRLGELGVLGVTVPSDEGGAGLDATAAVIVHHELAKYDPGFTLAYLAHAMLFVNNFANCANAEQRRRYLPKTLSGEWIAGMGMTEPGAGTDVLGMTTTAVRDGQHWVLNGSKTYITNACEGFCFLVYAKVEGQITAFVVDRDCPGFSTSQHIDKLGMRGSTMARADLHGLPRARRESARRAGRRRDPHDAQPRDGTDHAGRDERRHRRALRRDHDPLRDGTSGLRGADRRLRPDPALPRRRLRGERGRQGARLQRRARHRGRARAARIGSDAAKLFAAPVGKMCADYAMQVMGGAGYCREFPVERLWRDAKLLEIGGGTLEAHQKNLTKDLVRALAPR